MMWFCPNCKANTENDQCPQCGLPYVQGEATAATRLLKSIIGSTSFIVATVCITAAVILSMVLSFIQYNPFSVDDMDEAVRKTVSATNYEMPEGFTVDNLSEEMKSLVSSAKTSGNPTEPRLMSTNVPLLAILAIVGCWLLVGQSGKKRIYVRRGGIVCLKIYYIFGIVGQCCLLVLDVLMIFAMALFRSDLMSVLNNAQNDYGATVAVVKDILDQSWFQLFSFILCGAFAVIFLFGILFNASMVRTMNAIKYTSKTGNFTAKRASLFAAIIFILLFVFNSSVGMFTLVFDMNMEGIVTLLTGIANLLFAIAMLSHRRKIGKIYAMYVDGMSYKDDYQYEDGIPENAEDYYDPTAPSSTSEEPAASQVESAIETQPATQPTTQVVSQPNVQPAAQPVVKAPISSQPTISSQPIPQEQPVVTEVPQQPKIPTQLVTPEAVTQPVPTVQTPRPTVPVQKAPAAQQAASAVPQKSSAQPSIQGKPTVTIPASVPEKKVQTAPGVQQPVQQPRPTQQQEFEAFFARQEAAAVKQAEETKQAAQNSGKRCPRCGQPITNPYFCMNCGFRLK